MQLRLRHRTASFPRRGPLSLPPRRFAPAPPAAFPFRSPPRASTPAPAARAGNLRCRVFIPARCRLDAPHPRQARGPDRFPSPTPSASRAARVGSSDLQLPQRTGPCSATVPVADPCRVTAVGFAVRRCRLRLYLFPAPTTIIFPSACATSASTVPVSVTRTASGISTCSTTSRKKFTPKVATTNRFPVRSVSRSGLRHRIKLRLVPLPVVATVALPVRALHRSACRAPSRVASLSLLTRRSGFSVSLGHGPESSAVCYLIFSHFYARRRFLSHPTHR